MPKNRQYKTDYIHCFNEVRKTHSRTYSELKKLFLSNYQDVKKAKTELSNLLGYRRILSKTITSKTKEEIIALIKLSSHSAYI